MASIYITVAVPCLIIKFNAKVLLPLELSIDQDNIKRKKTGFAMPNTCKDETHQNDSVITRSRRRRSVKNVETATPKQNSSLCQISDINTQITANDVDISDDDGYSVSSGSTSISITGHSSSESNSENEDDVSQSGGESDFSDMSELTNLNCDESDFF